LWYVIFYFVGHETKGVANHGVHTLVCAGLIPICNALIVSQRHLDDPFLVIILTLSTRCNRNDRWILDTHFSERVRVDIWPSPKPQNQENRRN